MTKVEELRDRKQTDIEWHLCNVLGLLGLTNDDILSEIRKELDSLIAAAKEEERERIYAYANDPNNPYYSYDYSPDGFYLKASRLREFIKSGKEWVNPTHATPKRPVLPPAPKEADND
jgi:hypothetical protein